MLPASEYMLLLMTCWRCLPRRIRDYFLQFFIDNAAKLSLKLTE